jgi:hypothetical protein
MILNNVWRQNGIHKMIGSYLEIKTRDIKMLHGIIDCSYLVAWNEGTKYAR